jgi:hypothetical protein
VRGSRNALLPESPLGTKGVTREHRRDILRGRGRSSQTSKSAKRKNSRRRLLSVAEISSRAKELVAQVRKEGEGKIFQCRFGCTSHKVLPDAGSACNSAKPTTPPEHVRSPIFSLHHFTCSTDISSRLLYGGLKVSTSSLDARLSQFNHPCSCID